MRSEKPGKEINTSSNSPCFDLSLDPLCTRNLKAPSTTLTTAMDANLAAAILSLEHTYKSITYTCVGQGLPKDSFEYDTHPENFFPPKSSKTPKGGAAPEQPQVEKKPAAWWKAPCAFRGLNQSGAISDLQLRLKVAKKKMLLELKEAETQLNKNLRRNPRPLKIIRERPSNPWSRGPPKILADFG